MEGNCNKNEISAWNSKTWIISNPWCYLRVDQGCLTHQKRQNIGDSSGNRLFLDWFITEDTMKKKARQVFQFSIWDKTYTKVFFKYQDKYVTLTAGQTLDFITDP